MKKRLRQENDYVLENIKQYVDYLKFNGMSVVDNRKTVMKAVNTIIEKNSIGSVELIKDVNEYVNFAYRPFEKDFQTKILTKLGIEADSNIVTKFSKTFSESFSESFESLR